MAVNKRVVELPHSMLKELVKVYGEGTLGIPRIYDKQEIDGRELDLVGEKEIKGEAYQVFFDIKTEITDPNYIEEYLEFCQRQKPLAAFLIMPVPKGETRYWEDERFKRRRKLNVLPFATVHRSVFEFSYHVRYEIIDGKLALTLEPKPPPVEE